MTIVVIMDSNGETDFKPRVKMLTLGDFGLNRIQIFLDQV
jgi:hypothetical protein